jgi:hypothetical protein
LRIRIGAEIGLDSRSSAFGLFKPREEGRAGRDEAKIGNGEGIDVGLGTEEGMISPSSGSSSTSISIDTDGDGDGGAGVASVVIESSAGPGATSASAAS